MKTLILTRADVEQVATMELAVTAVERAFARFGRGEGIMPPKVYLPIEDHDGDFRAMPARLGDSAGIKWVNVHAQNRKRYGLPTVMAVYVLSDPANAFPLAVMDGTLLTALRTGAAGAVASKHLANDAPKTVGFIGCGAQAYTLHGTHQVVFGGFESLAHDRNTSTAQRFADRVGARVVSLEEAAGADIVCTATPSRAPFLQAQWVRPGAHINAIGADAPGKRELSTETLKGAAVYIDDIHHRGHLGRSRCGRAAQASRRRDHRIRLHGPGHPGRCAGPRDLRRGPVPLGRSRGRSDRLRTTREPLVWPKSGGFGPASSRLPRCRASPPSSSF